MFRPEGCPKLPYALGYTERGERLGYLSTHSHQGDNLYFVEFTDRMNQYVMKVRWMIAICMNCHLTPITALSLNSIYTRLVESYVK